MAVAEKPSAKTSSKNPTQQLAIACFVGIAYAVFCVSFLLSGLPTLWGPDYLGVNTLLQNLRGGNTGYLSTSLLLFVTAACGVGLVLLGRKLEGPNPLRGLRAGSAIGTLLVFFIFVLTFDWVGGPLVRRGISDSSEVWIVWTVIAVLGGGLLFGMYWLYHRPGFAKWLVKLEGNGWFHATSFKYNQGQKVRRATLIALLVIVGSGIYSNLQTGAFGRGNWEIIIPGTAYTESITGADGVSRVFNYYHVMVILYQVQFTMPLIFFALCAWVAWRAVNWPVFADFLIATEAELNKVSWTTRKRLFQDTVVVLVTVLLLTLFLFVVDLLWIWLLSAPVPGVLKINPYEAKARQRAPTDW